MDEVARARYRKFAEQISQAGWVLDPLQGDIKSSGFWLYSYSLQTGTRLLGQLTVEGYRAMCSGELLRQLPAGVDPVEMLGAFLQHYDSLAPEQRNRQTSEQVTMALAVYASQTRTLKSLPSLQSSTAQHLMVFDWKVPAGHLVLRPAAAVQPTPLSPQVLEGFSAQVLAMHLGREPLEYPV